MYERSEAPPPKGGSDISTTTTSSREESSIVRGAVQPSPTLGEQKPKESTHTVIDRPKQMLSETAWRVPAWDLYKQ